MKNEGKKLYPKLFQQTLCNFSFSKNAVFLFRILCKLGDVLKIAVLCVHWVRQYLLASRLATRGKSPFSENVVATMWLLYGHFIVL